MSLIFVYGTLKRGRSNQRYLHGQTFISEAVTEPMFRMYDLGGYPGMVRAPVDGLGITGEVWDVDDACLQKLDVLEGVAIGEYERVEVPLAGGGSALGYLYLWPTGGSRDIGATF